MRVRIAATLVAIALGMTALAVTSGCTTGGTSQLTGHADYPLGRALPVGTPLEVSIVDVSGDPAKVVARTQTPSDPGWQMAGQTTLRIGFAVRYDPRAIDPSHAYAIVARTRPKDLPVAETVTPVPVLTRGAPSRNVSVTLVERAR
jgi:uncharacterized lipoprotein YbaY